MKKLFHCFFLFHPHGIPCYYYMSTLWNFHLTFHLKFHPNPSQSVVEFLEFLLFSAEGVQNFLGKAQCPYPLLSFRIGEKCFTMGYTSTILVTGWSISTLKVSSILSWIKYPWFFLTGLPLIKITWRKVCLDEGKTLF